MKGERGRDERYERVDTKGNVIGIAIFNFLKRDRKTAEIPLEMKQVAASL